MKCMTGLLPLNEGVITIAGETVSFGETATNRHVGYLPDVPEFYPFDTARQYLMLCADALANCSSLSDWSGQNR